LFIANLCVSASLREVAYSFTPSMLGHSLTPHVKVKVRRKAVGGTFGTEKP
jgi:hypothetical protein